METIPIPKGLLEKKLKEYYAERDALRVEVFYVLAAGLNKVKEEGLRHPTRTINRMWSSEEYKQIRSGDRPIPEEKQKRNQYIQKNPTKFHFTIGEAFAFNEINADNTYNDEIPYAEGIIRKARNRGEYHALDVNASLEYY